MIHPYIPPARTIEFYGDSLSCGYGNEGIGSAYSSRYSNNYAAYPAITSRILHADYRAIAFSGEGVFRKYTGDTSTSLPKMHDRTFYHSDDSWDFSKWTPDAVVINLGTNDFAIGIPENNTFINAYIDFIKTLALHYPATTFFVVDGPDYYGVDFSQQLDAVVQECIDRDLPLHKISFSTIPDGLTGIGQHPNCAQHSHAADQLSTAIAEIMQWH